MTPARRNLFVLAENLGCFVADIEARMGMREYLEWIEYSSGDKKPEGIEFSAASASQLKSMLG
jgi:hypothetical protein